MTSLLLALYQLIRNKPLSPLIVYVDMVTMVPLRWPHADIVEPKEDCQLKQAFDEPGSHRYCIDAAQGIFSLEGGMFLSEDQDAQGCIWGDLYQ